MERHRLTDEQWSRMADLFGRPQPIGHPLHFELTAGQTHDAAAFDTVMVGADANLRDAGGQPVVWSEGLDAQAYRRRNIVERVIGWLKAWRRVFSRSEKTARNDARFIRRAVIQRYLRTA